MVLGRGKMSARKNRRRFFDYIQQNNLDAILRTSLASHYPDMGEVRLETLILEIAALITIEGSISHYPNQLLSLTFFLINTEG